MAYDQAVPLLELFHKDSEGSYDFSPEYSDEQPSDKQIGIAFPKERTQSRNPLEPSDRSRTSTPVPISNDLRLNSQRQDALNATNDRFSANDCSTMNSENPFALAEYDGVLESGRSPRWMSGSFYQTPKKAFLYHRIWFISAAVLTVLVATIFFLSNTYRTIGPDNKATLLSNGTSNFLPTTILISLDGFRADFLGRGLSPTLDSFVRGGVSPQWMLPSFPSVTFANHYTLVTGLYPESHGIVGNTFWDPDFQEMFTYADDNISMHPKWWGGEPLWVTAEKQGVRTATHMWPGSEAGIAGIRPTFLDRFNSKEPLDKKVKRLLELLDLPIGFDSSLPSKGGRPQLIAAYVPDVDINGHQFGPNSTEVNSTIQEVDLMFKHILQGLEDRNLTAIVNIVVVSDHGMATTSIERLVQLEDVLEINTFEHIDGWPLRGLRLKNSEDEIRLYDRLSARFQGSANFEIYLRDKNMPARYHFTQNRRIAPLWIVPKTGWAMVSKKDFDLEEAKASGAIYRPRGLHGYDHEHPLMRSIFIARGPAFPHKGNSRISVFQNTNVYNIVCDSLSIVPSPNNGTIRLPFRTSGLHSDYKKDPLLLE